MIRGQEGMATQKRKAAKAVTVELDPEAWAKFERAVDVVVKAKPMHRKATKRPRSRRKA